MTVRAILDTKGHQIQSVPPEEKLSAAIKILGERKIGAVLVMSAGRIEGILSERDIVRVLGERGAAVLEEPVSTVMTKGPKTIEPDALAAEALGIMNLSDHPFTAMFVIEDDKPIGIVSVHDLLRAGVM